MIHCVAMNRQFSINVTRLDFRHANSYICTIYLRSKKLVTHCNFQTVWEMYNRIGISLRAAVIVSLHPQNWMKHSFHVVVVVVLVARLCSLPPITIINIELLFELATNWAGRDNRAWKSVCAFYVRCLKLRTYAPESFPCSRSYLIIQTMN